MKDQKRVADAPYSNANRYNRHRSGRRAARRKRRAAIVALVLVFAALVGIGAWYAARNTAMFGGGSTARSGAYDSPYAAPASAQQIDALLENREAYPAELRQLLERNSETFDYVADYLNAGDYLGQPYAFEVQKGVMPHLLQWDKRWGYAQYGDAMMGLSGCAPTCLAMVSAQLTGDASQDPLTIAKLSEAAGYFVSGAGTSWEMLRVGCEAIGIKAKALPLNEKKIKDSLYSGHPVICSVGPGDFTSAGHFIVLYDVSKSGELMVKDPNSIKNTLVTWRYDRIVSQIKALWAYEEK